MARQQPKNHIDFEFLTITNPVQSQDAAHQKKVRKKAAGHYWRARNDLARQFTIPVDRQWRPFQKSPGCVCHGLGYIENGGTRKPCLQCGCDVSLRLLAEGNACCGEVNGSPGEESTAVQAGDGGGAEEFSALELESPRVLLGAGDRDPFSSFPVSTGQDSGLTEMLLRHWIMELSPFICTLEHAAKKTPCLDNHVTKDLVPLALTNATTLHSLLAYASSLMDARSGRKTGSIATLAHTANAVLLINESMSDIRQATSDEILSSILLVSGSNCLFKDQASLRSHMDGLYRVIELRGGIDSVRLTSPTIYWRVILMDQFRCLYTSTLPRYRLYASPLKFPSMIRSLSLSAEEAEPWSVRGVLSDQFIDLVEEVRDLVQLVESCRGVIVSPAIIGHFDHQRAWIAYRFLELIVETSNVPARSYEQCCCLAAFLYHHIHFRPHPFSSGGLCILLGKLKQALLKTDLDACWGDDIELLLWILVTAAAVEDVTKVWFMDLLKRVWKTFMPKPGVKRMKYILRRFLWNERTSSPDCEKVHKEILSSPLQSA